MLSLFHNSINLTSLVATQKSNCFEYLKWRLCEQIPEYLNFPCRKPCQLPWHIFDWSIVAVCCSLLGINKEEQVFWQAHQTQSLSVFNLFWVKYLWGGFGFAVHGSRCLWSMFVVSEEQSSCISLPLSSHSCSHAHTEWGGTSKVLCFSCCCLENVLLANALSHVQCWGSERILFFCTGANLSLVWR